MEVNTSRLPSNVSTTSFHPTSSAPTQAPTRNMIQSAAHDGDRRPGKRPAARGTAFYPRKRANTACQVCRARKTKCDNRKPACSYCISVGVTCIQSSVDLSSFDPASLKILERLDELERLMRNPRDDGSIERLEDAPLSPEIRRSSTVQCEVEVSTTGVVPGQADVSLRSILPEKLETLLQWPVFSKYSPPQATIHSPRMPLNSSSPTDTTLGRLLDMNMHETNVLLDNFFMHVHCKNPIFDEISTRRLVITVILEGIDWSPNSCLALIICALGRISTPLGPNAVDTKPGSPAYNESQCLFHAAQRRIGALLCETDIIGAQCLFLSGVYAMYIFQPFHAWRFFSQALAACQILPFLRRAYNVPEHPESSPTSAEGGADETREQAVYWSAWKSERELRRELVLPDFDLPQTNLYPPFFPTPPELLGTMDSARQRSSWLFYLAEISLNRLFSRVCSEIKALHASSTSNTAFLDSQARMVPEHEAQLHQWSDNLPPEFSVRTVPEENDDPCAFVLRGHFVNLFETLSWPFVIAHLSRLQTGEMSPEWERRLAEEGLRVHIRRICVNEPGFRYRHHGTWFMVRMCVRSAVVLLSAGLLGCEMPLGWRGAVQQVVELLVFWEDEVPELTEWRVFMQQALMGISE